MISHDLPCVLHGHVSQVKGFTVRDRHGTIEVSSSSGLGNWRRTCSLTTLRWMISWINIWLVVWNMNGL